MAQLMPLPLTVSCSSKIQTGFTFLVPAHAGSPGQGAVKRVCVYVCVCVVLLIVSNINSVMQFVVIFSLVTFILIKVVNSVVSIGTFVCPFVTTLLLNFLTCDLNFFACVYGSLP